MEYICINFIVYKCTTHYVLFKVNPFGKTLRICIIFIFYFISTISTISSIALRGAPASSTPPNSISIFYLSYCKFTTAVVSNAVLNMTTDFLYKFWG